VQPGAPPVEQPATFVHASAFAGFVGQTFCAHVPV